MDDLQNKRVTVMGLGHFGGQIAAARFLIEQGAKVLVTDKQPADKLQDSIRQLEGLPITYRLGGHEVADFTSADLVVTSPAVPPTNHFLLAARSANVPITTEIQLLIERCPAPIIGVTGTKGKSTTTALLGQMLSTRHTTHVGGNIGKSLLLDLPRIETDHLVVLELSSFMLHYLADMKWSPHVAVLSMLAVDHTDWHGSADAYHNAKKNIVRHQTESDFTILAEDAPHCSDYAATTPGKVIWFRPDTPHFDLLIPGHHNQFNARAAFTAAHLFGITFDEAQRAIQNFPGLPHRLELVHEDKGVRYFNDSIATIPEAAVAALESFPPNRVIQIVGGSSKKKSNYQHLAAALKKRAKAVVCIGETGPEIASQLPQSNVIACKDLAAAVQRARDLAREGDIVLLSTGAASYDQFENFQQRGETFTRLARQ